MHELPYREIVKSGTINEALASGSSVVSNWGDTDIWILLNHAGLVNYRLGLTRVSARGGGLEAEVESGL